MSRTVLRFTPSERWFHNSVMFTFVLLLVTGLAMIYFNVQGTDRDARRFLQDIHEIVAVIFVVVPSVLFLTGDRKVWRENVWLIRRFGKNDLIWLIKKPVSGWTRGVTLPKEDKFNPGQKVWMYVAIGGTFVLTATGFYIWWNDSAILLLFIHTAVAFFITPALLGHMYMALLNPETRQGVTAIIDGEVDADWAMAHHPLWMERHAKERVSANLQNRSLDEADDPPTEREL
jgi:formate dehydrogenase subunit gamma